MSIFWFKAYIHLKMVVYRSSRPVKFETIVFDFNGQLSARQLLLIKKVSKSI